MKTSLVITLKNEESTILELLGSIVVQSKKPDELVIVDGGSVDKTVDIIKNYMHNKKIPTRILVKKNKNIARGRNIEIINANSKMISFLDSDAYAHNTWIEKIIERFEKDKSIFLIGGKFNPAYKNNFSKAISISDETIRLFCL